MEKQQQLSSRELHLAGIEKCSTTKTHKPLQISRRILQVG